MDKWFENWQKRYEDVRKQWEQNQKMNFKKLNQLKNDTEFVLETWMDMEDKMADLKEEIDDTDLKDAESDTITKYKNYYKQRNPNYQGTVYFSLDMFDKAIDEFNEEIKKGNDDPLLHLYLGYAYLYTLQKDKAKENFLYVLSLYEQSNEKHYAYVGLGCLYGQHEEIEQAIYYFEKALSITLNTDVVYNLGICYLLLNRPQLALPYFESVIKYLPEDAESHYFLGHCYLKLGEEAKAFEIWYTALQLIEYKDLLVTLAYEFEQSGHYLVAIHCYKRLVALGFKESWVKHGIAWNYGLMDEKEKAKNLFSELLSLNPSDQNVWISYLWLLKKWDESNEFYQSVQQIKEQKVTHPLIDKLLSFTL